MGRRQEGNGRVGRAERQHGGTHIEVADDGLVGDERHLGLAGGARGEIENGYVGGPDFGQDAGEKAGLVVDGFAPYLA